MRTDERFRVNEGISFEEMGLNSKVVQSIISLAGEHHLRSLVLFGSRARGDFGDRSDIDLAVSGGAFTRFCLDVKDEVPTLLDFDFVNLDEDIAPALRENIEREGITLYEEIR